MVRPGMEQEVRKCYDRFRVAVGHGVSDDVRARTAVELTKLTIFLQIADGFVDGGGPIPRWREYVRQWGPTVLAVMGLLAFVWSVLVTLECVGIL